MAAVASIIMAAGRGSRMKGFEGNKTLLPLVPGATPFQGSHPILLHIIQSLPIGPKAVVVNHRKEEIIEATRSPGLSYCEQPVLNGTGGALLAAEKYIQTVDSETIIITMGDVPLVQTRTYLRLVESLKSQPLTVLGFRPADKRQYGVLDWDGIKVKRIVEWKYWKTFSKETQDRMEICNSGIYAARKKDLIPYLDLLRNRPHIVSKEREGRVVQLEEYFITDLIEFLDHDGNTVGCIVAEDEEEVMGVDDISTLQRAQERFRKQHSPECGPLPATKSKS
jgi:bifunctional UDP-N-acetylglucosamine pyrophosphorylase/glucosamine-1-phosphate N-acetyltransferase